MPEELDTPIPLYYVLGREIGEDKIPAVHEALALTPIVAAIVWDPAHRAADQQLALKFTRDVISFNYERHEAQGLAWEIHEQTHLTPIIIGGGASLTAHYSHHQTLEIYPSC